jgi:putative hemolysin
MPALATSHRFDDPGRSASIPDWSCVRGGYRARFARGDADRAAVQRLRFRVFHDELGATVGDAAGPGRDADPWDACADHVVVEHVESAAVVGTYRLATRERVGSLGFYAASEFNLGALPPAVLAQGVELGRACIDAAHRGRFVLALLWQAIGAYVVHSGKRFLFGCASVPAADLDAALRVAAALRASPGLRASFSLAPRPDYALASPIGERLDASLDALPPLLARYLALGAKLCGEPAYDRAFGTLDFFVLLDRDAAAQRRQTRSFFEPKGSESSTRSGSVRTSV